MIRRGALESLHGDYGVRALSEDICRGIRSKDYLSEILALEHFVERSTRYQRDPRTVELVKAPYVVVRELYAGKRVPLDCDDMTALLVALGLAAGAETRIVTVAFKDMFYDGVRQYSHVFCEMKEPKSGTWITCDPVAGPDTDRMLRRVVAAKIWPVA